MKVIIYFAYTNDDIAINVIRAGADGFVLKSAASEDMQQAIKTVMSGGVYLSPGFLRSFAADVLSTAIVDKTGKNLGRRLTRILKLTALGLSGRAIAMELKINTQSVSNDQKILMKRMGLESNQAIADYVFKKGLRPA